MHFMALRFQCGIQHRRQERQIGLFEQTDRHVTFAFAGHLADQAQGALQMDDHRRVSTISPMVWLADLRHPAKPVHAVDVPEGVDQLGQVGGPARTIESVDDLAFFQGMIYSLFHSTCRDHP